MTTQDTTNGAATDEVTRLQQRLADLEQQIVAHAATDERLNRVKAELQSFLVDYGPPTGGSMLV